MREKFNFRKILLMLIDILILSAVSIVLLRLVFRQSASGMFSEKKIWTSIIFTFLSFFALNIGGEYKKAWKFLGLRDYITCIMELLISTIASAVISYFVPGGLFTKPINEKFVLYWLFCFLASALLIVVLRVFAKKYFIALTLVGKEELMKKALIIGAGTAGRMLAIELTNALKFKKSEFCYNVIGFVDDDTNILNEKINGFRVLGTTSDIKEVYRKYGIDVIFFAIPSCPNVRKAEILEECSDLNCDVKIVPELSKLISGMSVMNQVSKIKVEDLLGRDPIKLDTTKLSGFISGKVCMVTGGGGSIGSELCRQIMNYNPKKLIIVDIYENNAYDIQQELIMDCKGYDDNLTVLIASVRDKVKMEKIFSTYKPELVFHAAAHKHVPLMETSPEEAVKNNVFGTYNVASLSDKYGVKKFVLVSTDKAVNPTNVMGATKRCCEMIVQNFSKKSKNTDFVAVRFGNVLGSNGSVIPLFKRQIENGKPITITHPEIIRYFMTIPEAVSLILTAGSMARGGEIFVLDMGKPVKILTLAENLIRIYGKKPYEDVKIVYTGLRPGEKLYEELLMDEEGLQKTDNQKIFIGTQIEVSDETLDKGLEKLWKISQQNDSEGVIAALGEFVPTFNHKTNKTKD